jgi:hypothetical protein
MVTFIATINVSINAPGELIPPPSPPELRASWHPSPLSSKEVVSLGF